ncbi:hypothetical protein [Lentzea sp. NPDC060358]|uniref:hypothetical protein n=1 Tax=Lentzea sp. NPDC060358 TaxID=3347103 RepID=UPI00365AB640
MYTTEVLGVVAHPGGLLVRRPELTVGVVHAVSGLPGLEIELLARRPLGRSTADARRGDGPAVVPAPRRLLPQYDEGLDLRVGRLDETGRAHWQYPVSSRSRDGTAVAPSHRVTFRFPPVFDEMALVLAWPEIGFPETVVRLPLPGRAAVERGVTSIWRAPTDVRPVPAGLTHRADGFAEPTALEAGTSVTAPRVLHRRDDRAVVLSRLTAAGPVLSMDLLSIVRGDLAAEINVRAFGAERAVPGPLDDPAWVRARGPGASVAVLRGQEAVWVRASERQSSGGDRSFSCVQEFTFDRPPGDQLRLVVAWPLAGLDDVLVAVPL